jgi:hypothetical protein
LVIGPAAVLGSALCELDQEFAIFVCDPRDKAWRSLAARGVPARPGFRNGTPKAAPQRAVARDHQNKKTSTTLV